MKTRVFVILAFATGPAFAHAADFGPVTAFAASTATSHIFGTNDRVRVTDDVKWKKMIGRLLNLATGGMCTASLVGKDLILTAAHCVSRLGSTYGPLEFQQAYEAGEMVAQSSVVKSWVNREYDFAILRLAKPLGEHGYFKVARWTPLPFWHTRRLRLAGYGGYFGGKEVLTVQKGCSIRGTKNKRALHDCDIDFGDSGAPIFTVHPGFGPTIVAVHTGALTTFGQMEARREYKPGFAHYGPTYRVWGALLRRLKRR